MSISSNVPISYPKFRRSTPPLLQWSPSVVVLAYAIQYPRFCPLHLLPQITLVSSPSYQTPSSSSLPTSTPNRTTETPSHANPSLSPSPDHNDDIPFNPNPDVENVPEFVTTWSSKLTSAVDFDNFCRVCDDLASAMLERGRSMSNRSSGTRGPPRPASLRTNRSAPHPHRARIHNNPREARRI